EITAAMTDLENTLDKETYSKIEHVSDLFVEETDIMGTEYFKCGLALGLQLMQESQEIVRYFGRSPDADEAEED
ncbi:MAG: hypothetical protein LUG99_05000, partial [Lachnospiraceae bacterium]|nr:hypothetical protein [Lachnospiraceae bacterium]